MRRVGGQVCGCAAAFLTCSKRLALVGPPYSPPYGTDVEHLTKQALSGSVSPASITSHSSGCVGRGRAWSLVTLPRN